MLQKHGRVVLRLLDVYYVKNAENLGGQASEDWAQRPEFAVGGAIEQVELRLTMIGFQRKAALFFLSFEGDDDVTVITQDSILSAFNKILDTMTLAVSGIGAISLLVAGILIMNVMLISVTQRTQEIGLLKAIGASDSDIMQIFLTEAVMMAMMGAGLGMSISELALLGVRYAFPDIAFTTPLWAMLLSSLTALVASLVFAWGPSRRAARLEPVNALQGRN